MAIVPDLTESLLTRTQRLLSERGALSLRQISEGANLSLDWLRSFSCGRANNPSVHTLEKLHNFLTEYHAARRFQERSEARAS